ncbi:Hypothetical protein, putative [Bodo saltans]|uniref:Uncharacterized protein n=1 Tax=Bodo saltans TaxID=75058 RepID=A0A0S4KRM4_BODSA|nr:Hypothetical protein, putative [Bodo saltans]|eukprot:CUI15637.1 Hypothetical protein, putative [Bodo saltans]
MCYFPRAPTAISFSRESERVIPTWFVPLDFPASQDIFFVSLSACMGIAPT